AVQAEVIWDDNAVDHRLTKTPAGFDHPLIGAGDGILGKHDSGYGGIKQALDDYPYAWPSEEAHTLAVRDRRVGVSGPPDFADGTWDISGRMNVQQGEVLAGEARRRAVFVNCGRPDGKRRWQGNDRLRQLLNGLVIPGGDGFDQVARQRHAGRDREA